MEIKAAFVRRWNQGVTDESLVLILLPALLEINSHMELGMQFSAGEYCLKAGEGSAQSPYIFYLNFRLAKYWEMKLSLLSGNRWGSGKILGHLGAGSLEGPLPRHPRQLWPLTPALLLHRHHCSQQGLLGGRRTRSALLSVPINQPETLKLLSHSKCWEPGGAMWGLEELLVSCVFWGAPSVPPSCQGHFPPLLG